MNWLGDYPEDFTTVCVYFTTHDGNGAPVAPLTAFEAADVSIYKNGSATQKTSTNGVTMTSPFDSIVGLHCVVIDTSNDTGDSGFWTTGGGGVYTVLLNPDTETVNSQVALKVIGTFGIALSPALRPTTAGRTIDVTATGEAGIDWANVGSPTTTLNLSGTTIGVLTSNSDKSGYALTADFRIKKNTALAAFPFRMTDSSDHVSPKTGLTVTGEVSLNGGAFGALTNAVAEISSGWYKVSLAAADLNADTVALKFTASGADQLDLTITTQTE